MHGPGKRVLGSTVIVIVLLVVSGGPAAVARQVQAQNGRQLGSTPASGRMLEGRVTVLGSFGPGKADTAQAAPDGLEVSLLSLSGGVLRHALTRGGGYQITGLAVPGKTGGSRAQGVDVRQEGAVLGGTDPAAKGLPINPASPSITSEDLVVGPSDYRHSWIISGRVLPATLRGQSKLVVTATVNAGPASKPITGSVSGDAPGDYRIIVGQPAAGRSTAAARPPHVASITLTLSENGIPVDTTQLSLTDRDLYNQYTAPDLQAVYPLEVDAVSQPPPGRTPAPVGWDHLGTGATPTTAALNGSVNALNADAPGALYVGGAFTDAGGKTGADYIAKWSRGAWQSLGPSALNGAVQAIAYRAGKVYAGGVFTNAGGDANLDFLAEWDGEKWGPACNATGPVVTGNVNALQIVGSTLYIGGNFANGAGIVSADYLLACNLSTGVASSTVLKDGEFSGPVYALAADSRGTLYAGGGFGNLTGIPAADKVAAYAGGAWHALGSGPGPGGGAVNDFVRSLAVSGTDVYVGTDAKNIAGIAQADNVAKWDGSAWSALGSSKDGADGWFPASAFVYAITTSGSRVFVGGAFQNANGDPVADWVASFSRGAWQPLGSNGAGDGALAGNVAALANQRGELYVGGNFASAGGDRLARSIASYAISGA